MDRLLFTKRTKVNFAQNLVPLQTKGNKVNGVMAICKFCGGKFSYPIQLSESQVLCPHCALCPTSIKLISTPTFPLSTVKRQPEVEEVTRTNKAFSCISCSYESAEWEERERHFVDYHTPDMSFSCHLCPFHASSLHHLDLHMMTHANETNDHCAKFGYLNELRAADILKLEIKAWEKNFIGGTPIESESMEVNWVETSKSDLPCFKRSSVIVQSKLQLKQSSRDLAVDHNKIREEPAGLNYGNCDVKDENENGGKSYSCPFCEFVTRDQRSFAHHFNSHSLVFP